MHNYDKSSTFKIYRSFIFGEDHFERECSGQDTMASKSLFYTTKVRHTMQLCHVVFMSRDPSDAMSKISLPENEPTVNVKSASFVMIMHLPEGLTHIQSQIKPWLHFGESFTWIGMKMYNENQNHGRLN